MSVNEKMAAIADNIRNKTGGMDVLTLDQMANSVNEVYEAGKQENIRCLWETIQVGGARTNWQYAFYGSWWTDEVYNPIYPIKVGNTNTNMYYNCKITNTKVGIDISGTKLTYTFRDSEIETIPELRVTVETDINNAFTGVASLKNINIFGTLGKSVKINMCPLTVDSIKSIVNSLCDYTGTENEYAYTVTFKTSSFEKIEKEGATALYNGEACTWAELIDNKKWNLVKA